MELRTGTTRSGAVVQQSMALEHLSEARKAVEKARTVQEVKDLRDKAEAVRQYAKQAGMGREVLASCAELKLRAERKAGELLRAMAETGERERQGGNRKSKSQRVTLKLPDLGLTRKESSRWQLEAEVPEPRFEEYVARNRDGELTSSGLLKLAKSMREKVRVSKIQASSSASTEDGRVETFNDERVGNQIRCLYVDPPWSYGDDGCSGGVAREYPTMPLEAICALPVWKLLHRDGAHVWMWTTWPMIRDGSAHKVLAAWSLRWVGEIVWVKPGLGVGRWLRPSTEVLTLAVCERNMKLLRNNQRGHQEAPRAGHSAKPSTFYDLIESLSPGPRMELFARKARNGWFRWGNQA